MKTFRELMGFGFMPQIVFDTGGDSGGGGSDSGSSSSSSSSSSSTTTTDIPVYDNYYDAIDAEGVGATVNIGGNIVSAETADGYTGSSNTPTSFADDFNAASDAGDISAFMPPTSTYTPPANNNNDNDNDSGYDDFAATYDAQLAAADSDPYGMTTADGYITSGGLGVDVIEGNDGPMYVGYDPSGDTTENLTVTGLSPEQLAESTAGVTSSEFADAVDPVVSTGTGTSGLDASDPLDPFGGAGPDIVVDPATGQEVAVQSGVGSLENAIAYSQSLLNNELNTQTSGYEDEAYGGPIEDFYNDGGFNPPSNDDSFPDTPPPSVAPPEPPAPPPVFYDAVGNPYGSQEEASAADAAAEQAAAQAAANMAAAFDEPTAAEIAAANAAAQREAYDDDEYTVMSQPVAPAVNDPTGSEISYADILSSAGVSDEEIDSMRENILTGDTDFEPEPLDFSFLDETNELLTELGVAPIDIDALAKVGDTGINLEVANAPAAITEMAIGDDVGATDDDLATDFSVVPTGVGATDDDLATDFSTVSTDTDKDLAFQNYLDGLVDRDFTDPEQTGLEAFETAQYDAGDFTDNNTVDDFMTGKTTSEIQAIEDAANIFQNEGAEALGEFRMDLGMSPIEPSVASDEAIARAEADMNALDILSEQTNVGTGATETSDIPTEEEISQVASTVTGQTGSELYLSAMEKVSDPNYNPNDPKSTVKLSNEEQYALYGARGRAPNAAETAYLNDLLSDARHKEDVINPDTGEVIAKAGDYVTDQSFMDQAGDVVVNLIDTFLNPFSIFGDQFTISGNNKARVEKQLEAYKNGGTFIYGEDGRTVIGVAEPNYDASGDGNNDTVVFNDDGTTTVVSKLSETDVNIVNNDDNDDNDISVVDSTKQYENTEDGVVVTTPTVEVDNDNDNNIPICEEGFEFDPVEGICMPIDEIGDGTRKIKFKPRPIRDNTPAPTPTPTPTPDVGGLIIRQPQFNRGGVVTRNIDKFANGGVVTPNIDNFLGGMRR